MIHHYPSRMNRICLGISLSLCPSLYPTPFNKQEWVGGHQRSTRLLCCAYTPVVSPGSVVRQQKSVHLSLLSCSFPPLPFPFLSLFFLSFPSIFLFGRLAVSRSFVVASNNVFPHTKLVIITSVCTLAAFLPSHHPCNTLVGVVIDNPPFLSLTHSASSFGSQ